jgi:hypothetical protein
MMSWSRHSYVVCNIVGQAINQLLGAIQISQQQKTINPDIFISSFIIVAFT